MLEVLIALAGGLGAGVRFILDGIITHRTRRTLPLATLIINVAGSFLLGAAAVVGMTLVALLTG